MRNWDPYLFDTIRELAGQGVRRVLGFILAAHRCEASWERYRDAVSDARSRIGMHAPEVEYPRAWHTDPKFIAAVSARAREAFAKLDQLERRSAHLIFTAHSVPVSMSDASGYANQIRQSAGLVAAEIGQDSWTLAFQSRSGSPRDPWLEPDIGDVIRKLEGRSALVVPIGFLCDHVEVLYDLDVEAAKIAREERVNMVRAATVGDHPVFIGMITDIARQHLGR
jgi:ferrochelatase